MSNETIKCYPLYEGTFSIGRDKKMKPINPEDRAEKGALKVSINPFLITTPNRNILIDTGLGPFGPHDHRKLLCDYLAEHDLTEYDITDIFLSHLHYDHIGGLAHRENGHWELTFPDACIYTHEFEWNQTLQKYGDNEDTPLLSEFVNFINARADFHFVYDSENPIPEINIEVIGGHTPYSLALWFSKDDSKFVMAGDVLGSSGSVNRKYNAKYDYDGKASMEMREKITRQAWEERYHLLFYHGTNNPIVKLDGYDEQKGYGIKPITYEPTVAK